MQFDLGTSMTITGVAWWNYGVYNDNFTGRTTTSMKVWVDDVANATANGPLTGHNATPAATRTLTASDTTAKIAGLTVIPINPPLVGRYVTIQPAANGGDATYCGGCEVGIAGY